MKLFWGFIILLFQVNLTLSATDSTERINGENGWYVPQEDGTFEWVDKDEYESLNPEDIDELETELNGRFSLNNVDFYLFTRQNPDEPIEITDTYKSVSKSTFNASHPTKFVIHGWLQDDDSYVNKEIKEAWLSRGENNIIVVNWSRSRGGYLQAVHIVPKVGKKIATLLDYLVEKFDVSLDKVDIIGHSLGAHVAAFAAKKLRNGQVYRIVGLDPAMPLYSYSNTDKRLCTDDAQYVETIQTNGGKLGFIKPIGKATFYPNGGKHQPGCGLDPVGHCSHKRSVLYYAESVAMGNFPAVTCPTYKDAGKKQCGSTYSSVRMCAESNVISASGVFYVPVRSDSPFGFGEI